MRYCCGLRVACYGYGFRDTGYKKGLFPINNSQLVTRLIQNHNYTVIKIKKILPLIYCMAFFLFSFGDSMAESNMVSQSSSATASLNFKIHIPETLYLQIGTITQKKDEDASDANSANKTRPVSQDKKSCTVKTSGKISKGGMIFLSSGNNNLTNGLHSKTTCYILSSP